MIMIPIHLFIIALIFVALGSHLIGYYFGMRRMSKIAIASMKEYDQTIRQLICQQLKQ